VNRMSSITRWMRALVMWSAASLSATVARPVNGEPSRCLDIVCLLEKAHIDIVEAGLTDRHVAQGAAAGDDAARDLRPDVGLRIDPPGAGAPLDDTGNVSRIGERGCKVDAFRFHLDHMRAA